MKMPGFAAEISLYEAKGHYRMAGTGGSTSLVLPQACVSTTCWNCQIVGGRCKCTATGAPGCAFIAQKQDPVFYADTTIIDEV